MKYLIILLITFSAFASYLPKSKVGQDTVGMKIYSKQSRCESQYQEACIKITENNSYNKIIPEQILEENNITCVLCDDEYASLECSEGFSPARGLTGVYCEKVIPEHIGVDQALKDAHDADKLAKETLENGIAQAMSMRKCGERVMALMLVRNSSKGLSTGQIRQLVKNQEDIERLLSAGSLATAKEDIQASVADGVLITEDDKTALSAEIDKCLGL